MNNISNAPSKTNLVRPKWLKVKISQDSNFQETKDIVINNRLNTVCFSSSCPNISQCWQQKTATFMILGNVCTRACRFCHIKTNKLPPPPDSEEPQRLAKAIKLLKLEHIVITCVARDDLSDGGAKHFCDCIDEIRLLNPGTTIEILTSDFAGNIEALNSVIAKSPEVFNHNIETVERLTAKIRSGAKYHQSLKILHYVSKQASHIKIKSGIMLGLGENETEVQQTILDLKKAGVKLLTIGQYLQPSPIHHPIMRYAKLEEFDRLKEFAYKHGFSHVQSGPLVRSSYHAKKALS